MSLRPERAVSVTSSPVGDIADSEGTGTATLDAHRTDRIGQPKADRVARRSAPNPQVEPDATEGMAVTTDFKADIYKQLAEIRNQNERLIQMMAEQNAEITTLKGTVVDLQESLRLKDRKTLTAPEAARYAGVKPTTVRRWLESGRLKGTKRGEQQQSHWIVRRHDLDRFLERVNNTPASAGQSIATSSPSDAAN